MTVNGHFAGKVGPAVLVVHPWWGLNQDTIAFTDRLGEAGFQAFAPDLFEGKTADTIEGAEALTKDASRRNAEVEAALNQSVEDLVQRSGQEVISLVGFSYGAYHALELSNNDPLRIKKAVIFYGTGPDDFNKSDAAYLGHFAENDDFEPKEAVDALADALTKAGRPNEIHTYPDTGHWFFEPSVKEAYNRSAAELAWQRTIDFLKQP